MADNRKIITGTYIVPKMGNMMEDTSIHKYVMDTAVGSTLGYKGVVEDIATSQTDDNWYKSSVTFTGPYQLRDSNSVDVFRFLYVKNDNPSGGATLQISLGAEGEWNDTSTSSAAWGGSITWNNAPGAGVRNAGYWNPDYFMQIPPGASIQLRGDGNIKCDAVHVYAPATSTIEFVIAK